MAAVLGALAVGAAALVVSSTPAAAAGTLTPWSSTAAVGAMFSVTAGGCPVIEEEHDGGFTSQQAVLVLTTTTAGGERMAAFGEHAGGTRYRFRVPGWVDPADAAVVAGACIRTEYSFGDEEDETIVDETEFVFPDAAIDIVAGTAVPSGPVASVDRNTAAGGQVITVTGSGCQTAEYAEVVMFAGSDLSGRTRGNYVVGASAQVADDGTFTAEVALNGFSESEAGGGPLAEGPYVLLTACGLEDESGYVMGEPLPITVSGTNPSGSFVVSIEDDVITAMGGGCLDGQEVTVELVGYSYDLGIEELDRQAGRALARGSIPDFAKAAEADEGQFETTLTVTPGADGTWSVTAPAPAGSLELTATADCGDPAATGFRYVRRFVYESNTANLYVERSSPTSSPAGGSVLLVVNGMCEGETRVALVGADREIISQSEPFELNGYGMGSGTVQAPNQPGRVYAVGVCDDEMSYPLPYEVFAPETVSATAPLPGEPAEGWPSQGPRETYHGKIGPIMLPAMEMDEGGMETQAEKAMGPGGLFIPVPRPDGDFAITKLTFDLVDAEGMPVDQDHAHLHHFVITDKSEENPACSGSTFGLPGQIVGAAGAERTVLQTGDPYGLVVEDTDEWTGVYELMSRSMEDQEVFLTYDIDYRRDVQNVRPVTTYFGSATGCGTFTWTLDGSGTPDTQRHFVTIDKPGRLIGAGGHIHNGGLYADWTNDRGRRLCRSTISYGDEPVGHDMGEMEEPGMGEYPPEFRPGDLAIEGISNCPLAESLSAGERLEFSATYDDEQARSGVMGIFTAYVWEGGGPAEPGPGGAEAIPGTPNYTG